MDRILRRNWNTPKKLWYEESQFSFLIQIEFKRVHEKQQNKHETGEITCLPLGIS